jgi:hypothetical protein
MSKEMEDDTSTHNATNTTETQKSPTSPKNHSITVEDSIKTITDILNELEEDDPLVQTQPTQLADIAH